MTKIIVNKAKCLKCNSIIESKHVHDFVNCACGAIAVDGGKEYLKRCGYKENIEEMSEIASNGRKFNLGLNHENEISAN